MEDSASSTSLSSSADGLSPIFKDSDSGIYALYERIAWWWNLQQEMTFLLKVRDVAQEVRLSLSITRAKRKYLSQYQE